MITLQMDKVTACSPWERAKSIYDKTVELESKRQKAAQARRPSDPNLWQLIRENYEAIILEDHAFSEKYTIEFTLWQLHYKRIEEFRSHINAASASSSSIVVQNEKGPSRPDRTASRSSTVVQNAKGPSRPDQTASRSSSVVQNVKGPSRPDRTAKLKLQFRTFLSEATGFYHDMILKIRSKYGLPLGYFSNDHESKNLADKDGKKLAEVKKGLVSCHRCLIYLGDLARYKGLYGEGDSKNREYAAASSYYLQAASLLPASGNPHHQLAIIASYSGDEFAVTYRYFRSLAVESPFPTARDNLIVAFEKNRQSYALLFGDSKDSSVRLTGKGRGIRHDISLKDASVVAGPEKDKVTSENEALKAFYSRFIRLNGILFTRTSLETFLDVLASTSSTLRELISSSSVEELSFGMDTSDSALFIVRLVTILIFSVHNSKKETEGQLYAEIVQRVEPARNSLTASFELLGHVIEQCAQLHDPSSSYFLPGVLAYFEWLACYPDMAQGIDTDDRQTAARTSFWNQCVTFFNKILSLEPKLIDDVEKETENRLALWEDNELRGFLPLLSAQSILDFSRKISFETEGAKEKKARVKRILAAWKSLTSVIKVYQNHVYFDSEKKKFIVGVKPTDNHAMMNLMSPAIQPNHLGEDDDDDEVIVFKPLVSEKKGGASDLCYVPSGGLRNPDQVGTMGEVKALSGSDAAFHENALQARGNASIQVPAASVGSNLLRHLQPSTQSQAVHLQQVQTQAVHPKLAQSLAAVQLQPMQSQVTHNQPLQSRVVHFQQTQAEVSHVSATLSQLSSFGSSNWLPEEQAVHPQAKVSHVSATLSQLSSFGSSNWLPEEGASGSSSLSGFAQMGNGHVMRNGMQGNHGASYYPARSLPIHQSFNVNGMGGMSYSQSRTPEALLPTKLDAMSSSGVIANGLGVQSSVPRKNPIGRAFSHLGPPPGFNSVPSKPPKEAAAGSDLTGNNVPVDDYSWLDGYQAQSSQGTGFNNYMNYASSGKPEHMMGNSNGLNGATNFPFPGKQIPAAQAQADFLYYQNSQKEENPQSAQGQSSWSSRQFV